VGPGRAGPLTRPWTVKGAGEGAWTVARQGSEVLGTTTGRDHKCHGRPKGGDRVPGRKSTALQSCRRRCARTVLPGRDATARSDDPAPGSTLKGSVCLPAKPGGQGGLRPSLRALTREHGAEAKQQGR
jgi:hypothetical protein